MWGGGASIDRPCMRRSTSAKPHRGHASARRRAIVAKLLPDPRMPWSTSIQRSGARPAAVTRVKAGTNVTRSRDYASIRPVRTAMRVSSTALLQPSLAKMRTRWVTTVFGLIVSRAAVSRVETPAASRRST